MKSEDDQQYANLLAAALQNSEFANLMQWADPGTVDEFVASESWVKTSLGLNLQGISVVHSELLDLAASGGYKAVSRHLLRRHVESLARKVEVPPEEFGLQFDPTGILEIPMDISFSGVVNAFTAKGPSGGPVIVVDDGASTWLHYMFLAVLESATDNRERRHLAVALLYQLLRFKLYGEADSFRNAAMLHKALSETIEAESVVSNSKYVSLQLAKAANEFIILHELGHALLGHLDRAGTRRLLLGPELDIEIIKSHYKFEFEADLFAALSLGDRSFSMAAPILFSVLALTEKSDGRQVSDTHPGWNVRWSLMRQTLLPEDMKSAMLGEELGSFACSSMRSLFGTGVLELSVEQISKVAEFYGTSTRDSGQTEENRDN